MKNRIEIWTDGSCPMNRGSNPGGWASILVLPDECSKTFDEKVVINNNTKTNTIYKCIELSGNNKTTTSNRMECEAVIEGIKKAVELGFKDIQVYSDSQYVVKTGSIWMHRWEKNDWKKNPKNLDLVKELFELYINNKVTLNWVKSHNGNFLNERADELAGIESAKLMGNENG